MENKLFVIDIKFSPYGNNKFTAKNLKRNFSIVEINNFS